MRFEARCKTERLTLRPIQTSDIGFYSDLHSNADVRRYLGGPVPPAQITPKFKNCLVARPNTALWLVETSAGHSSIGIIQIDPHKDGKDLELSYQFGPTCWGVGYASEAAQEVLKLAHLAGLKRIVAETQAANLNSCRLLQKLEMTEDRRIERFGSAQIIFAKAL